jgi:hypothetical protein
MFLQLASATLVVVLSTAAWFFAPPLRRLAPLFQQSSPNETIRFTFSPNEVDSADVSVLFILILWRWLKTMLGINTKIKFVPVDGNEDLYTFWHHEDALTVHVPFQPSPKDKISFARALLGRGDQAFKLEDYHLISFLTGVTFPANLLLLASPYCPIQLFGSVNTSNEFDLRMSPEECRHLLEASSSKDLTVTASLKPVARKLPRGWEFELILQLRDLKSNKVIFAEKHMFMQFAKHKDAAQLRERQKANIMEDPTFEGVPSSSTISFSTKNPRSWAAVCKDYNLIHVLPVAARAFGFRAVIAHGNHVTALALASERTVKKHFRAALRRPVLLPASLEIHKDASGSIGVFMRDKLCIVLTDVDV